MESNLYGQEYGENIRALPALYKSTTFEWLKPSSDDTVLEIGTNKGELLDLLKQKADHAFGMDLNQDLLTHLRKPNSLVASGTDLPFSDHSIDKSVSIHVIEHIPDLKSVFQELDRVTRENGLSFHAFPSALIRGLDGAMVDAWKTTHNPLKAFQIARQLHVHNLNPKKLERFLEGTHWKIVKAERKWVPEERGPSWFVLLKKE